MDYLTSRSNPMVTHIRKLNASRSYRRKMGEFCCEGPKLLQEALRWGAKLSTVVVEKDTPLPQPLPAGIRMVSVPAELLRYLSDTENPQGVLFLCKIPGLLPPERLEGRHYLALDGLQDPGNVGTIWRTADAFGADGLFLMDHCADPFAPKTVRATMGAVFRLPIWEIKTDELSHLLRQASIPLYAAALSENTMDVRDVSLTPAAVMIGSEGGGVSQEALHLADRTIKVPMRDRCESLNAAVAASVILWEMIRNISDGSESNHLG